MHITLIRRDNKRRFKDPYISLASSVAADGPAQKSADRTYTRNMTSLETGLDLELYKTDSIAKDDSANSLPPHSHSRQWLLGNTADIILSNGGKLVFFRAEGRGK